MVRFMSEKWRSDEIVVESGDGLAWFDRTKLHEWGFILRLEHEWGPEVELSRGSDILRIGRRSEICTFGIVSSFSPFLR